MDGLLETPVGQLVVEKPSRARIFQKHKIDFCCGGGRPLSVVCAERNIDQHTIVAELSSQESRDDTTSEPDWSKAKLSDLVDNILAQHHDYLRNALPHLGEMAEKVYRVHGERHPEMLEVLQTFSGLYAELDSHMYKEENILFPAVKNIEKGSLPAEAAARLFGPISVMEQEHESAGQALLKLRELTNNFTPPADACNTFKGLYAGLEELEHDLHWHIHKENNILFPRALQG